MKQIFQWFDQLKEWGFSPSQAHALWQEHRIIASPILWSRRALRQDKRLRAAAWVHRSLRERLMMVDHPRAWAHYWKAMPDLLRYLEGRIDGRKHRIAGSIRDYWTVIAMGEGPAHYDKRIAGNYQVMESDMVRSWDDLLDEALHSMVLERMAEQTPCGIAQDMEVAPWQEVLHETGLRSIRWGWLDHVGTRVSPGRMRQALLMGQAQLARGVGLDGGVLGLGGRTSLVLMDRAGSDGLVQPDSQGYGQTLTIDTWSILAHEWLHVLDRSVGMLSGGHRPWATTTLLDWNKEEDPPELLLIWFEIMAKVMLETPPTHVLEGNIRELPQWSLRATLALGGLGEVREEIIRQQHMLDHGTWNAEVAELGWLRVLDNRPVVEVASKTRRTAKLLVSDIAYMIEAKAGRANGGWMDYLGRLPEVDGNGNSCNPGVAGCPRYLSHPVEIMARSFEAAMGMDRDLDSVWVPHSLRPNAGLMWPLLSETAYHNQAWKEALDSIEKLAGHQLGIKKPKPV